MKFMPKRLAFGTVLALMLYAMFPAFIIATIFDLCQNLIDFQTVFFVVFFIYQIFAFGYLMKMMNSPQSDTSGKDF